jgi:hypothetical protein
MGLRAGWQRRPHAKRHRQRLEKLEADLRALSENADQPGVRVLRLAPVIEVCGPSQYPAWRQRRERLWRQAGDRNNTQGWPDALVIGQWAAVLLPWPHMPTARRPKRLPLPAIAAAGPHASTRALKHMNAPHEWIALGALANHVADLRSGKAGQVSALYAPPVIDLWDDLGRSERPFDLGFEWRLEAPR